MRIQFFKLIIILASVVVSIGCSDEKRSDQSGITNLEQNVTVSGTVSKVGEVDWYRMSVDKASSVMQLQLSSNTYRADVDLLATVYELDANGEKVRLYADHAPEDSQLPANVKINIGVSAPKDIYISVRDLMDDESSDNKYYLSVDLSASNDGNDSLANAQNLQVDDQNSCHQDSISYIGDIDSYTFNLAQGGVFQLLTEFAPFSGGTEVGLSIKLYDDSGNVIDTLSKGQGSTNTASVVNYSLVQYLSAGTYYALVEDYGRDDFDTSSSFQICLNSVENDEANVNDLEATATVLTETSSNNFSLAGSLDYKGDEDWYLLSPSAQSSGDFQVLDISFDTSTNSAGNQLTNNMVYQLDIRDAAGNIILSHNHNAGSSAFQTQIKVEEGDYYIHIMPSTELIYVSGVSDGGASYSALIEVVDVEDSAENGDANNTIDTPDVLAETSTEASGWTVGKVAYRGDEDWYEVTTVTDEYKVLELYLETDAATSVEYYMAVMRDSLEKSLVDTDGSDGATSLKTSILIEPTESGDPVTYYIKVADYQADDGDSLNAYRIRANVLDIPTTIPVDSGVVGTVSYYGEIEEQTSASASPITLEHNSSTEKQYLVNATLLNFDGDTPNPDITRVTEGDVTIFTFPWVAGYIDFEGDQDWFKVNLDTLRTGLDNGGQDTDWYYDIKVDMHVGNPGSSVEYVWKLYRDLGQNNILVDGATTTGDGFFASAGDTGIEPQGIDISTPDGDAPFWANQDWQGAFYFSMSDFNYVASMLPDDDWAYDLPYYFQVTLVYHAGVSRP